MQFRYLFNQPLIVKNADFPFTFQFGNTCYCNSVLQALYFCKPFRDKILEYKARNKRPKETLLTCLADLFHSIATQKKKVGSIAPKKFIARLRKEKGHLIPFHPFESLIIDVFAEEFDNYMQQDAHEFLNFLINHISEIILGENASRNIKACLLNGNLWFQPKEVANWARVKTKFLLMLSFPSRSQHGCMKYSKASWLVKLAAWIVKLYVVNHPIKQLLTNDSAFQVSSKDEHFFDLQVDVEQNTNINHSLRCFSNTEILCSDNKFKCDNCRSYQEAQVTFLTWQSTLLKSDLLLLLFCRSGCESKSFLWS